jgi:CRP-like cAMP-binding protein
MHAHQRREMVITYHDVLIRKLKEHSRLDKSDIAAIRSFSMFARQLDPNEDFIRQGDRPKVSALVVSGVVARYHLLSDGRRQYLSYHLPGDLPDAQGIFVERMDHAVCAIGPATLVSIPHKEMIAVFDERPSVGFAIWRETLIDAAIFREAITNNSTRSMQARMAHLFCQIFYRARASELTKDLSFALPASLAQLGETLGMSLATVNRTLAELRASGCLDFRSGELTILDWDRAAEIGQFDPMYLHLKKPVF